MECAASWNSSKEVCDIPSKNQSRRDLVLISSPHVLLSSLDLLKFYAKSGCNALV